jgi:hypothetical protein
LQHFEAIFSQVEFPGAEAMQQKQDRACQRLYSEPALVADMAQDERLIPAIPQWFFNGEAPRQTMSGLSALQPDTPLWSYPPGMRYYSINERCDPQGISNPLIGSRWQFGSRRIGPTI